MASRCSALDSVRNAMRSERTNTLSDLNPNGYKHGGGSIDGDDQMQRLLHDD